MRIKIELTPFDLLEALSCLKEYISMLEDDSVIRPVFNRIMDEAKKMTLDQIEDAEAEREMYNLLFDSKYNHPTGGGLKMTWKKIDPDNLPKGEVVTMNKDLIKHKYIGIIRIVNDHVCTDDGWIVTHYTELPKDEEREG